MITQAGITRLHERAESLYRDIVSQCGGVDPDLPEHQVMETSRRLAHSLATCLAMMAIEADPKLRRNLDPTHPDYPGHGP